MDKIKRINLDYIQDIYASRGFTLRLLVKDYYLTLILYLIRNVEGIYFKGGTAINKIFLNHSRLSEDIDFTLTRNIAEVKKEIAEIIQKSGLFEGITEDKNVEGFLRMIIHYNLNDQKGTVFIDLNQRGNILLETENHVINHFYTPTIPQFSIKTLAREELIAEKVAASIGRNKPRDHFDVYQIIHANISINMELVKKKCRESGDEFSIIKMFNQAKKLKNRWDKDMMPLLSRPIAFRTVIKFLAQHFKLKDEKKIIKDEKKKSNMHKKGFIRTLEAVIAVIIIFTFIYFILPKTISEAGDTPVQVKSSQDYIVSDILYDETRRADLFAASQGVCPGSVQGFVGSLTPFGFANACEICEQVQTCIGPDAVPFDRNVYVNSIYLITLDAATNNPKPKVLRVYMWEQE